jgi:SPP1 gp7 family putative phage head morphogenesis protein
MKLFRLIAENYNIMKGSSPVQIFYREMRKQFEDYSEQRSREALEQIISNFENQSDVKKIIQQDVNQALDIVEQTFLNIPTSITLNLLRHNESLYRYARKPLMPIQKAEGDMKEPEPDILQIDPAVIGKLTQGNIVWIQNHASNSELSMKLAESLKAWKLQGLTMWDIAEKLKIEYLNLTPASFSDRFAERDYWKIVTQNHTARITSYANIDDYEAAGYEYYEWITREDGVCDICAPMNGLIFRVSDARARINDYYAAAETGNIDGMKAADPFLKKDEQVPNGIMPQVHIRCFCEIRQRKIMEGWKYDEKTKAFIQAA